MKNIFDLYTIVARILPTAICLLPCYILYFFLVRKLPEVALLARFISGLCIVAGVGFVIAFYYFCSQIIRMIAKVFERRLFLMREGFPTTYLMSYSHKEFSDQKKGRYRKKISIRFKLKFQSRAYELSHPVETRKLLDEANTMVLSLVRNRGLVFQHNVWYGFFRNLVGGSSFTIVLAALNVLLSVVWLKSGVLTVSSALIVLAFVTVMLFSRSIIVSNGEAFARQVITEFLAF